MTQTTQPYSEHIYDQERIDLARTILEKESRKLFPGLSNEALQAMDQSIRGWAENPIEYHLEDDGPRDFWDSFAAIMEGIKLKPNFTSWITAENILWHRTRLPVRSIQMTSPLAQLKKVPGLNLRNDLPIAELADLLDAHPDCIKEQKQLIDEHSTDPTQDTYPIIVVNTEEGLYKVLDGNRRTLQAVIYGKDEIEAWVGKIKGTEPTNFWVPLNDLYQFVIIFKQATDNGDGPLQNAVVCMLKARFKLSPVAEQAYRNRIGNQTDIAKRLLDLAKDS